MATSRYRNTVAGLALACAVAVSDAAAKPPGIGADPQRSAWVMSQRSRAGQSCCGLGDGRMVDSRIVGLSDDGPFIWQIKLYRAPFGRGWLFGIPEEAQISIDPDDVHEDQSHPGIGWVDVPPELENDSPSFTGKGFAWWSIGYRRLECFRRPLGF